MGILLNILLGIFFSLNLILGASLVGRRVLSFFTFKGEKISFISALLWGLLPQIYFQFFFSALNWETEHIRTLTLFASLKFIYFALGLIDLCRKLPKLISALRDKKTFYKAYPLFLLAIVLTLFLPAVMIQGGFHPSWDYDFIQFWWPKIAHSLTHGYLSAATSSTHPAYIALGPRLLASVLPAFFSTPETIVILRGLLLIASFSFLFYLSQNFSKQSQIAFIVVTLSGYPLKWINAYQDQWLALSVVWVASRLLHSRNFWDLDFWTGLALTFGLKDEGIIFSGILFLLKLLQRDFIDWRLTSKRILNLAILFIPLLFWKFHALFVLNLSSGRFGSNSEFLHYGTRIKYLLQKLGHGISRAFQSYFLEGLLSLLGSLVFIKKTSALEIRLWLAGALFLLLPLGVILKTPSGYESLLDSTISRVTASGLILWIYLFFHSLNKQKA